ncbi:MAG: isocitrate lyase/PEP mutase family protein [Proteobacteria bacterium]|nr:isocitrate lyase/PEP mutase family protein [Burkholderiales bacterium]
MSTSDAATIGPSAPPARASTRFRQLLAGGRTVFVPGCFNAVSARVIEVTGFPAAYMTGYGTSVAQLGMPDVGFATMSEMHTNARWVANAVSIPVIADADNGYGNAINVTRTVREYIQTGVAGIHLEDQSLPKRCGHVAGREVIPLAEAVGKIRAADAVRRATDPDFVLIARTDARGAVGGSLDEAIARVNAYLDAGADLGFVEGPTSVAEVERICRETRGPVFYNMTGVSPRFTLDEMNALGIAVTITANTMLRAALTAMYDVAIALRDDGPMAEAALMARIATHPVGDLHRFSGLDAVRRLEEAYLPAEELAKYEGTIGYRPLP